MQETQEDTGLILVLETSLGRGNVNPPQCSCLGNPIERGTWWATVHGVAKCHDKTLSHEAGGDKYGES